MEDSHNVFTVNRRFFELLFLNFIAYDISLYASMTINSGSKVMLINDAASTNFFFKYDSTEIVFQR